MTKKQYDPVEEFITFVTNLDPNERTPIYMGIDPGSSGAIAIIASFDEYTVVDIPVLKVSRGKKEKTVPNYQAICQIFRPLKLFKKRIKLALEEAPPTIGPGKHYADIILNRAYAIWPLFLNSKGISVTEVLPQVWKRQAKLYGLAKDSVRHKAISSYPRADLSRVKDHNRAEALLLADWIKLKDAGKN